MTSSSRLQGILIHSARTVLSMQERGLNLPKSLIKQTSVICKMIPFKGHWHLRSHQTQFPHVYVKTDKCPFQRPPALAVCQGTELGAHNETFSASH